jgi:hypothetical protein
MAQPVKPSHYALLESFLLDPNTVRMRQSEKTSFHLAMIVKRGQILKMASNRIGTRSRGCGYADYTIHAERNVMKQLGDTNKIRGCDLYVMRIQTNKSTGECHFGNSKPCHECSVFLEKCQRQYGLKSVYYTDV